METVISPNGRSKAYFQQRLAYLNPAFEAQTSTPDQSIRTGLTRHHPAFNAIHPRASSPNFGGAIKLFVFGIQPDECRSVHGASAGPLHLTCTMTKSSEERRIKLGGMTPTTSSAVFNFNASDLLHVRPSSLDIMERTGFGCLCWPHTKVSFHRSIRPYCPASIWFWRLMI